MSKKIVLGIVAVLLFGGVAFAGVMTFQDPTWFRDLIGKGLPRDNLKALQKIETEMNKLETVRTSIDVSINIPINNINFNLDKFINLEQDTISPDKLIIKANIETQKLTSLIGSLTLGTDNELNNALAQIQNIKVDSVIDGKEVYLKLPAYLGENWVYFPESTTENLT